jgi:hypothetical protein
MAINGIRTRFARLSICLLGLWVVPHSTATAVPLLPDLFSWEDAGLEYMHGGTFDIDSEPGKVFYRFNVAIPNIGDGAFEVEETTHPNGIQDVYQNIYDSGGGFTQTLIGSFQTVPNPPFGHLHLEGLAFYSLREVTAGNGVGSVIASKLKTSHGLVDSVAYDTNLPGAPQTRVYFSAQAQKLGVSVGWADLYSKSISTQFIDVTGLASGQYWLEVEIDPNNIVQETDDTNNVTRILVDLQLGGLFDADFDLDGDVDQNDLIDPADGWETRFGADLDGSHFLSWQQQLGYGVPTGASPGLATVPEPTAATIILSAALAGTLMSCSRSVRAAKCNARS